MVNPRAASAASSPDMVGFGDPRIRPLNSAMCRRQIESLRVVQEEVEGGLGRGLYEARRGGSQGEARGSRVGVGGEEAHLYSYLPPLGLGIGSRNDRRKVLGRAGRVGNAYPAQGSVGIVDPQPPSMGLGGGDAHDDALPLFHGTDEGQYGVEVKLEPALSAGDVLEEAGAGFHEFEDWLFQGRGNGGA